MAPERNPDRSSSDEVAENAKEFVLKSGNQIPVLITAGSKNLIVNSIEELPPTHSERMQLSKPVHPSEITQ